MDRWSAKGGIELIKTGKIFGTIWWWWFWPPKWGAFLRGTYQADEVPFELCEIAVYRSVMCAPCLDNGACIDCGCKMPDKMMDLQSECSRGSWDAMTIEQWREYKAKVGLKFNIEYAG